MTISIVTGGCGFIGSHIVDKLVKLGHEVRVIDDLSANENEEFYYNEKAKYWKKTFLEMTVVIFLIVLTMSFTLLPAVAFSLLLALLTNALRSML